MDRLDHEVRRSLGAAGVPDAGVLAEVVEAWPAAVGPAIARAAWPARIGRDGTLHVNTVSATWAFELGRLGGEIRSQLADAVAGDVPERLRFTPGPLPEPGPADRSDPESRRPTPTLEEVEAAAEIARDVEDDELRELIRRAAAASLASRPRDRSV